MGFRSSTFRRALTIGLAVAGACFAFAPGAADAAVQLTLSWPSNTLIITTASPFAQVGSTPNSLTVNTSTLNAFLSANGSAYQFSGLSASSNAPGTTADGLVSVTGEALLNGLGESNTIQIVASDNNFTLPVAPSSMLSSATGIFTGAAAGNSQITNGYYSPTNTLNGTDVPAGAITFNSTGPLTNSHSGNTPVISVPPVIPYALTDSVALNLTAGKDQFAGTVEALPEPTGASLLLLGIVAVVRRRR